MEEKLRELIGKKVRITFESKRFGKTYNLTGTLTGVDWQWSYFVDVTSDYPFDFLIEKVNTLRIRSVEEVSNEEH
jgi:hypothetical protein